MNPGTPVIVAGSLKYLRAAEPDLADLKQSLKSPDLLSIVSGGTNQLGELTDCLLPVEGRLRNRFGGSMHELNTRVVTELLKGEASTSLRRSHLAWVVDRWCKKTDPLEIYRREPMTDEEVTHFITKRLDKSDGLTQTRLLRELRDSGRACEQKRFRSLFKKVEANRGIFAT